MAHFPQPNGYEQIGTINKVRGLHGEMIIALKYPNIPTFLSVVYIYQQHTYIPYRVSLWQPQTDYATLQLLEIAERTEAKKWHNCTLFADADVVRAEIAKMDQGFLGYAVYDEQHGALGEVVAVEKGLQMLLCIRKQERAFYMPLHEHFVKQVNPTKKIIVTSLSLELLETLQYPAKIE